jgi:hypothetical protein
LLDRNRPPILIRNEESDLSIPLQIKSQLLTNKTILYYPFENNNNSINIESISLATKSYDNFSQATDQDFVNEINH